MKYIAHRGYSSKYTENTKEAIQSALDYPINMIETDVRLSQDNQWMVFHDATLTRLKGLEKWIHQMNRGALSALGIPTLSELLAWIEERGRNISLYIDIKGHPTYDQVCSLVDVIQKSGWPMRRTYLASFNGIVIEHLMALRVDCPQFSGIKIGFIGHPILVESNVWFGQLDFASINSDFLTPESLRAIRKRMPQTEVYVYVLNDLISLQHFQAMVVDGLLSDDVSLFDRL